VYLCTKKHKYIPKDFKQFLIFMKVECILNHVISHNLNHTSGYHVTNLKFFISENESFQQRCNKCVVN
jgi:hypothetical protein